MLSCLITRAKSSLFTSSIIIYHYKSGNYNHDYADLKVCNPLNIHLLNSFVSYSCCAKFISITCF